MSGLLMVRPHNSLSELRRPGGCSRLARAISVLATALLVALALRSAPLRAGFDVIQGDLVTLARGPGNAGGAFNVDVLGRGTTSDFETFCAEMTEHIGFGSTYYVENVGVTTIQGNKTLGAKAAWLYTQYLDKNSTKLAGFNFLNPTPIQARDQANAVQFGIWSGMTVPYTMTDIINLSGWSANYVNFTLVPLLATSLFNFQSDVTNNIWFGTGDIKVMNLRAFVPRSNGAIQLPDGTRVMLTQYAQDQLYRVNSPELRSQVTPEPPTLYSACTVVACALLWGIFSVYRKRAPAVAA
jgi:hypothetical protein